MKDAPPAKVKHKPQASGRKRKRTGPIHVHDDFEFPPILPKNRLLRVAYVLVYYFILITAFIILSFGEHYLLHRVVHKDNPVRFPSTAPHDAETINQHYP